MRDLLRDWEGEALSVIAVARACGFTHFHFIRLSKAVFGETPHQYRSRAQVEKAKHLLILTDLSITDVAWQSVSPVWAASVLFFHVVLECRRRNFNDGTDHIATGTAAARQLEPRLSFAHGWNFGERAIFEKTARRRGWYGLRL